MNLSKITFIVAIFLSNGLLANAQSSAPVFDKSPMDMCYYPVDYPILKIQDKVKEPLIARVVYSRPQKKGRKLFGDLVPYGQVWRLGANEATEIEFFQDVMVGGKKVKKGRYTIYALVDSEKWTMILNRETDTWGAFRYETKKDVLRTVVPVNRQSDSTEAFSMAFEKTKAGADLVVNWDDVVVRLPMSWQ